jgi:hypothetical protein
MLDALDQFASTVHSRLRTIGFATPSIRSVQMLVEIAYVASQKAEEGRFLRGTITYADPVRAQTDLPLVVRADYPALHRLDHHIPLSSEALVKLVRAVDSWSGSILVYGNEARGLFVWGIADQLVQRNVRMHHEASGGFAQPGILTISVDGIGELSAFHQDCLLAAIRGQSVVRREVDALRSKLVGDRIVPVYRQAAERIASILDGHFDTDDFCTLLFDEWVSAVSRLCIGLRRSGTGGAFIITPRPDLESLSIGYAFPYSRLADSLVLGLLHRHYERQLDDLVWVDSDHNGEIPRALFTEIGRAQTDAEDREEELTGAVKLITSLASLDGAVVVDPQLRVFGFGAKIGNGPSVRSVYDGESFSRRGTKAAKVDLSGFGTRHLSMLRYCRKDAAAVGVVVSQDGQVRLAVSDNRSMTLWENVKLLDHDDYSARFAQRERERRERVQGLVGRRRFGYTALPKTLADLLRN